ncbi:FecR domain-containing protein [Pedobacter gandavensis]|uniref:FecR family protein n=1 Tax=Pedobacter gandavensis TaxID=2679963 RepID=UPI002479A657|nr:FecR domain-containing protein [Pedobacter gandavensis]WGQ10972.1 FecR domain-containing protein [Pedobacter gandavensis]
MEKHEYVLLFEKHLAGKTSPEEEQLLKDHQDDFDLREFPWEESAMGSKTEIKEALYRKLQKDIHPTVIKPLYYKRWTVAAAILIICSLGLYYTKVQQKAAVGAPLASRITAGGHKAVLTLSDGSEVTLNDTGTLDPIKDGLATISNNNEGILVYHPVARASAGQAENPMNTISIPRGGQYQVVLPDGTKVWLNAASSLSFPTDFSGLERRVQLKGEAYFEVAKNTKMPFKVEVKGMSVKVLGTHFNVMAYDDEQQINTTLLEGSVEVASSKKVQILKPGEQATLKKSDGTMDVNAVNTAEFLAWKNGSFMFTDENIETIMRKIARWYDVEVIYKGNLSDKVFAGSISKEEDISEVLKMLELTGTIHFKVEGRRVIVMP